MTSAPMLGSGVELRHFHLGFWHCAQSDLQYRMAYCPISNGSGGANYELRLYEGQTHFDVIYGTVDQGNSQRHGGSAAERQRL